MPYITPQRRKELLVDMQPQTAGELNYAFTLLAIDYLERQGKDYAHMNDVIGALEGAKLEFYRRVVSPYENIKKIQNGDVYPPL